MENELRETLPRDATLFLLPQPSEAMPIMITPLLAASRVSTPASGCVS